MLTVGCRLDFLPGKAGDKRRSVHCPLPPVPGAADGRHGEERGGQELLLFLLLRLIAAGTESKVETLASGGADPTDGDSVRIGHVFEGCAAHLAETLARRRLLLFDGTRGAELEKVSVLLFLHQHGQSGRRG